MQVQEQGPVTLVTGGTGHLGRELVGQLLAQGRAVRVLARTPGDDRRVDWARGDLASGEGLKEALRGVDTVINAATFSPIAQRGGIHLVDFFRSPDEVDVQGTRRLLEASRQAGVGHFVHVSIVGLDAASPLPYNRVKLAGEALVKQSDLPWSVVRATPFFYLLARLLASMRWLPVWPLPNAVMQPVGTADVATHLVECAAGTRRGMLDEIGGPEAKPFPEFARDYLAARDAHRWLLRLNLSDAKARRMGFVAATGRRGVQTWQDWLRHNGDEPRGRVRRSPAPSR